MDPGIRKLNKTRNNVFSFTVSRAINWRILVLDYIYLSKYLFFFPHSSLLETGREKRKTGDKDEWGYQQKPERALKMKNHNICSFWSVCESS